jgi:hypothetical protein
MQTCQHCHIGQLHKKHIPYANWHASEFVVVQNMPAWQCDVCAYCELDAEVINRLLPLLGPVTRPDPTQPRRVLKSAASATDPLRDELDPDHDRRRV